MYSSRQVSICFCCCYSYRLFIVFPLEGDTKSMPYTDNTVEAGAGVWPVASEEDKHAGRPIDPPLMAMRRGGMMTSHTYLDVTTDYLLK